MLMIDARKRARKLITLKSVYGAIIACLYAPFARYAANYKRYVKNTVHFLFEENPY